MASLMSELEQTIDKLQRRNDELRAALQAISAQGVHRELHERRPGTLALDLILIATAAVASDDAQAAK